MNEILDIKLVQLCKDNRSRDYNDLQCGSDVNWDLNL